jgi:hypothetical protein
MALPNFATTGIVSLAKTWFARNTGCMSHIACSVVDDDAVKLIRAWIKQLPR